MSRRLAVFALTSSLACLSLAVVSARSAAAQDEYGQGGTQTYSFAQSVPITRCAIDGKSVLKAGTNYPEEAFAPSAAGFVIIEEVVDTIVIKFLNWEKSKNASDNYAVFNVELNKDGTEKAVKTWCVAKKYVKDHSQKYYVTTRWRAPQFAFGVLVVPVKLRPGYGDLTASFTTDFSLGAALDMTWQISNSRSVLLHVPLFVAVGSATVKASESKLEKDEDKPTLSMGLGLGFSGDGAGAAIIGGIDVVNDNEQVGWEHQWKPWIGFSIGTSFGLSASPSKEQ